MANEVPYQIVTRSGNRSTLESGEARQQHSQAVLSPVVTANLQPCTVKNCKIIGEHRYHCPLSDCRSTTAHRHNRSTKPGTCPGTEAVCSALGCHIIGPHRYHCRRENCQRKEAHRHAYRDRRLKKPSAAPVQTSGSQLHDINAEDTNTIVNPDTGEGSPISHPQPTRPNATIVDHDNGIFDYTSLEAPYSPGLAPLDPVDDLIDDINFANHLASQYTTFTLDEIDDTSYQPIVLPLRESFYPFSETATYITDYDPSNPTASEYHDFPFVPQSSMYDNQQYLSQNNQNEPCVAPKCPIPWPHAKGPYQHNIGLTDEHEVFGRSNPPEEIWQALERVEKGEGSEEDVEIVKGFVEEHA